MRALMYHYVRPGPESPPFEYYHLNLDDFRDQLDYLQYNYEMMSKDAFISIVKEGSQPPKGGTILTFDDGLIDHHKWVLPELRKRNLWGIFFVPGPIGDVLLPVHRIHTLLGVAEAEDLLSALFKIAESELSEERANEFERIHGNSNDAMSTFKRVLTYNISYSKLPEVLDILEDRFTEATVEPDSFYMKTSQLRDLTEAGMIIGGHTVSHPVLSRLLPSAQEEEVRDSIRFVEGSVGAQSIRSFAYPYGTDTTFDENTLSAVQEQECDIAFTTVARNINQADIQNRPFQLPRRDCNEFPHGSASRR